MVKYAHLWGITAVRRARRAPLSLTVGLLSLSGAAKAHDGHGMPGVAHWHSTDVWGFVIAAGIAMAIVSMKGPK